MVCDEVYPYNPNRLRQPGIPFGAPVLISVATTDLSLTITNVASY